METTNTPATGRRSRSTCVRLWGNLCSLDLRQVLFPQEGNDGLKFTCRSARNFAYGFHNDLDPRPKALLDTVNDGSNISRFKPIRGHNLDTDPVQSFLNDLSLPHMELAAKDMVKAYHSTPIRSDHDVFDATNNLF